MRCLVFFATGSVGWLVGGLAGLPRLVGCVVGRLCGWWVGWLVGLVGWLPPFYTILGLFLDEHAVPRLFASRSPGWLVGGRAGVH